MEQSRYYWIDSCKTFGLLLVILGHGRLFPETNQQFIYSFHMPLFFVLSGLLYKYKSPKETFLHDVKRLLIPYLIINFICLAIQCGLLLIQGELTVAELWHRVIGVFCVACYSGAYPPASVPTWFIIALFFVRMLLSMRDSKCYRIGLTLFSVIVFLIIKYYTLDPWLPIDTALMAIPFMFFGIALKPLKDYKFNKSSLLVLCLPALMIILLVITNTYNGLVDMSWCSYGNSLTVFYLNGLLGTLALLVFSRLIPVVGGGIL